MKPLTQSIFLAGLKCRKRGWHTARLDHEPPDEADAVRAEDSRIVADLARALFLNCIPVPRGPTKAMAARTAALLPDSPGLLDAVFISQGCVARVPILERAAGTGSFRLIDVSTSLEHEALKPEAIDRLAYAASVVSHSGTQLSSIEQLSLSRDWRLGMPTEALFIRRDLTTEIRAAMPGMATVWNEIVEAAHRSDVVAPEMTDVCRSCDFYTTDCHGKGIAYPLLSLPRLEGKRLKQLVSRGCRSVEDIPLDADLTENQQRVADAVRAKKPIVDDAQLAAMLGKVVWPAYYLDFESVMTAVPLWRDVAPYEQVLTQYSLHICDSLGTVTDHRSYLADHNRDSRRDLAERLLSDLGERGSIVVYSHFEKTALGNLAKLSPDLAPRIDACIDRLFDLEKVFKEAFCHPDFQGLTSIKKTLPALVDDLGYSGLEIQGGQAAIAAFVRLARGAGDEREVTAVREALGQYCAVDTLGMVRLHEVVGRFRSE